MSENCNNNHGMGTILTHAGYDPMSMHGFVNPPVIHASTVLFPDTEHLTQREKSRYVYGRRGTPTTEALEQAISELEGAAGTILAPSGMGAIALALMSCLNAGDHLLVTDSAYHPTRYFCDTVLIRLGIEITYYDPLIGPGIEELFQDNTAAIFTESPGSLTFEMQDIDQIAEIAHRHGAMVLMDNTWATPLFFKPFEHGVDISVMAGTKYVVGHSDVMIGTAAANARAWPALLDIHGALGQCAGPDDIYLALRGLRTMGVRLRQHMASALEVAQWLEARPEVTRVLHPGLESHPGHDLWKRDFAGSSGLFSFELTPGSDAAVAAFLDGLQLFGLGYSWGGYESLATWPRPNTTRTATQWPDDGPLIRLHIGLEDVADLIADLEAGLKRYTATG